MQPRTRILRGIKMKNKLKLLFVLLVCSPLLQAAWVDDWITNSTSAGPDYYEGQKRGYMSAGSYTARWKTGTDALMTAQAPSLSGGCGGIDLFLGSMTFADPQYLVQKVQRMIQNSAIIMFDTALGVISEPLKTAMQNWEQALDRLNGLQFDECSEANNLVMLATGGSQESELLGGMQKLGDSSVSLGSGLADFFFGNSETVDSNNGRPTTPEQTIVNTQCPAILQNLLNTGSLLESALTNRGVGQYADEIRGLIGDVGFTYDTVMTRYESYYLPPCNKNGETGWDAIIDGTLEKRAKGLNSQCVVSTSTPIRQYVMNQITIVRNNITSGQGQSAADEAFLRATAQPVYKAIISAIQSGDDQSLYMSVDLVARGMAYQSLVDIYDMTLKSIISEEEIQQIENKYPDCRLFLVVSEIGEGIEKWHRI